MECKEALIAKQGLVTSAPETNHPMLADILTEWEDVTAQRETAGTDTSASSASNMGTDKAAALSKIDVAYGMRSNYLRYNLWSS